MSGTRLLRRPRHLLPVAFSLLAVLLVLAGGYAGWALTRTPPAPALQLRLPATLAVAPGTPPAIPAPAQGSWDLTSSDGGRLASHDAGVATPIGSIAKVMAALVALQRMPLTGTDAGPTYTITAQDVALYRESVAQNGSSLFVSTGERFTERQMLLALLLPSADNLAETLGDWVAGSDAAFVAEMNAEADALGMRATHFADVSGLSDQTVSTPADLVTLGEAVLANPVLAGLVATRSAVMPDGTRVDNLDTDLASVPGWLGIKTGSTPAAGGCLLFAAEHPSPVGSPQPEVQVVGAVLGQPLQGGGFGTGAVLATAAGMVRAAFGAYATVTPARIALPADPGRLRSAWGTSAGLRATRPSGLRSAVVRRGAALRLSAVALRPSGRVRAGTGVARVTGSIAGTTVVTWTLDALPGLGEPSWPWLLTH